MAANSAIEWTDHTFNPWWGCTKVSEACAHCYAETFAAGRLGLPIWGAGEGVGRKFFGDAHWREPVKWNRLAAWCGNPVCKAAAVNRSGGRCACGLEVERQRVFCASMADVFEGPETIPVGYREMVKDQRHRLFRLILDTPHLDWLLLTKRPANVWPMFGPWLGAVARWNPPPATQVHAHRLPANVWVGTTVENQKRADERIPELLKVPAAVRFLSMEPLLGPVDLRRYLPNTFTGFPRGPRVNWVILGGESGHGARPMHPDWARQVRDQCQAAGVPFFFKQWGEWHPNGPDCPGFKDWGRLWPCGRFFKYPNGQDIFVEVASNIHPRSVVVGKVGKKASGRLLDGQEFNGFPTPGVGL